MSKKKPAQHDYMAALGIHMSMWTNKGGVKRILRRLVRDAVMEEWLDYEHDPKTVAIRIAKKLVP